MSKLGRTGRVESAKKQDSVRRESRAKSGRIDRVMATCSTAIPAPMAKLWIDAGTMGVAESQSSTDSLPEPMVPYPRRANEIGVLSERSQSQLGL